ncbi:site-specific integrase [Priestia sp. YIM B13448]|uniref:site-specific integrase n=1 Tax=Priestia sp. YIM B13448 TaxID=3366308 RepID=UPI00366E1548
MKYLTDMKNLKKFMKKRICHKKNTKKREVEIKVREINLKERLPDPTIENPYVQVDFIFQLIASQKHNVSTQSNYKSASTFYKKYLQETYNYDERLKNDPRFYLHKYWDEFALVKVKSYIDQNNIRENKGYLTSHTIVGHFSAIRNVMEEAVSNKVTAAKNIFIVPIGEGIRETENNQAYSEKEMECVTEALRRELQYSYKVLRKDGYKKTGVGRDPRAYENNGTEGKAGWGSIDNFRWYFENVLECEPIIGTSENKKKHKSFIEYAPRKYFKELGGLPGIYKGWGVTPFIDLEVIMPLVTKLALETGLNPNSIYELNVNCYGEQHPLSGVPYLKYYKLRSGGEKEIHLSLDKEIKNSTVKEFRHKQAQVIKKTIQAVLELTKEVRKDAPENMKEKLFLYQSTSQRCLGEVRLINSKTTSSWCQNIVKRYDLKSDKGEKLKFNLSRLRPTRATRLVEKGIDVFELQHEMGHKDIQTTLRYIEKNHLNYTAIEETNKALENIFLNLSWAEEENPSYATKAKNGETVIYKGIACDCKNPFNPPKEVKQLKGYTPGQVCNRYNMCFFCENVLVFKKHLPMAWVYKKQIEMAISKSKNDLPNEHFYRRTLDIIEHLFDIENSEFTEEDLEWAKEIAETMDEMIDPVTYIPVVEGG